MPLPRNIKMTHEEKINLHMGHLGCTREEAEDIIKTDRIIDEGGRTPYDMSREQEKEINKLIAMHQQTTKPKNDGRGKARAENTTKSGIIKQLYQFLVENNEICFENVRIENKERLIHFQCGENEFDITLIQKRKKKNA